jgi:hypothetical protein
MIVDGLVGDFTCGDFGFHEGLDYYGLSYRGQTLNFKKSAGADFMDVLRILSKVFLDRDSMMEPAPTVLEARDGV